MDLENYTKYAFSMYGKGDVSKVKMRFVNDLVSMVLDRFGHDIMLIKDGDAHFTITEPIAVSPQFFAWIFGLGEKGDCRLGGGAKSDAEDDGENAENIHRRIKYKEVFPTF